MDSAYLFNFLFVNVCRRLFHAFQTQFFSMRLLKKAEILLASSALIFSFARKEISNHFHRKESFCRFKFREIFSISFNFTKKLSLRTVTLDWVWGCNFEYWLSFFYRRFQKETHPGKRFGTWLGGKKFGT